MADIRSTANRGELVRYLAAEDGKLYRGHRQEMDGVMERVARLDRYVNSATRRENPNGWRYLGSIPVAFLLEWMKLTGTAWADYWANRNGEKERFARWFMTRDNGRFLANPSGAKANPSIVVPTTYRKRET